MTRFIFVYRLLITLEELIKLFENTPFINGGLFEYLAECSKYESGFSKNEKKRAKLPDFLFFKVSPTCPTAYALVSAHVVRGNYSIAIEKFKKAVGELGEDPFLYVTGAIAYTKNKEFDPLIKARKKDFCKLMLKYHTENVDRGLM